jgi:hypothetical protein
MTLAELAAFGNFIGGLAVCVSFIFLALQLRQANRNQRSLMQHGRSTRTRDVFMRFGDPAVTALVLRAFEADPTLSDAEYFAFYSLAGAIFMNYEDSFRQFRAGTLDRESWESDRRTLEWLLTSPGYRAAWRALRESIGDDYRQFLDTLMANTPVRPLRHHAALLRQYIAEETAGEPQRSTMET